MKATGIVRRIDDLGRVVIPKEIRRTVRATRWKSLRIPMGKSFSRNILPSVSYQALRNSMQRYSARYPNSPFLSATVTIL